MVEGLVTTVTFTFSMLAKVVGVTEVLMTANNSSVPLPPLRLSPEFNVWRLEELKPASKVSLPAVPANVFVPVVRDLKHGFISC